MNCFVECDVGGYRIAGGVTGKKLKQALRCNVHNMYLPSIGPRQPFTSCFPAMDKLVNILSLDVALFHSLSILRLLSKKPQFGEMLPQNITPFIICGKSWWKVMLGKFLKCL